MTDRDATSRIRAPFARTLGIHTDDIISPHLDKDGYIVPDCNLFPDAPGCDHYELQLSLIKPKGRPVRMPNVCDENGEKNYYDLHSVKDPLRNDYDSTNLKFCPDNLSERAATPEEMIDRMKLIAGHEVGHALAMVHNNVCGNIEYIGAGYTLPFVLTYDQPRVEQIRLVPIAGGSQ